MRLGLYGGSFDPFHYGHLWPAAVASSLLGLDRLEFVVTGAPPHKRDRQMAPALDRLAMAVLGTLPYGSFAVSRRELDDERVAYTAETLAAWREREPDAERVYLIGADSLADLPAWRDFPALLDLATFAVLARPGSSLAAIVAALPEEARRRVREWPEIPARLEGGEILLLPTPGVPVSATQVRERVAARQRITGMVPPRVEVYIMRYGLYCG